MRTLPELEKEFLLHRKPLMSYLYRLLAHRQESEDACSSAYLKAKESLVQFRGESSLKTWLFSIATRLALDRLRERKRWSCDAQDRCRSQAMASEEIQGEFQRISRDSPAGRYEIKEHIDFCFTCLEKTLPLEGQVALLLKDVHGFRLGEISAIMGVTVPAVKHALHSARMSLTGIFDGRCSLVNKSGTCYQCSELNGYFNPKQDAAGRIAELDLHRKRRTRSGARLLGIRTRLVSSLDPLQGQGADLHQYLLDLIRRQEEA